MMAGTKMCNRSAPNSSAYRRDRERAHGGEPPSRICTTPVSPSTSTFQPSRTAAAPREVEHRRNPELSGENRRVRVGSPRSITMAPHRTSSGAQDGSLADATSTSSGSGMPRKFGGSGPSSSCRCSHRRRRSNTVRLGTRDSCSAGCSSRILSNSTWSGRASNPWHSTPSAEFEVDPSHLVVEDQDRPLGPLAAFQLTRCFRGQPFYLTLAQPAAHSVTRPMSARDLPHHSDAVSGRSQDRRRRVEFGPRRTGEDRRRRALGVSDCRIRNRQSDGRPDRCIRGKVRAITARNPP